MKKISVIILFNIIFAALLFNFSFAGEKDRYWKKFNTGSWVLYELQDGLRQKITLTFKTDAQISLKTEMIKDEAVVSVSEEKIPLDLSTESAAAPKPGMREYVQDTMVVNQVMPATIYESDTKAGIKKSWFSEQIPGGLVKSSVGDSETIKLIDYEAKYYIK